MALIKITDNLLFNVDKDNMSDLVFLDFKQAFDLLTTKFCWKRLDYMVELLKLSNSLNRTFLTDVNV